jgi:hypothetical protein
MLCRHCRCHVASRPRGLCWACYYCTGIRRRYPSTSKYARRGVRDFHGRSALAPLPTPALPGSPEKVAVLRQRARMRVELWHPQDAGFAGWNNLEGTAARLAKVS